MCRSPWRVILMSVARCSVGILLATFAIAASGQYRPKCSDGLLNCAEIARPFRDQAQVGHDQPAMAFYSGKRGAGNRVKWIIHLPKDPPVMPLPFGNISWNFQLHQAFWVGMILCDTESAPEFTKECSPNSNRNIREDIHPASPRYIGKQPGSAYMQLQFYPPGWVAWPRDTSCDATHWCAALTVFSFNVDLNRGINNNADCIQAVGLEPVNFAFITRSGIADSPADPLRTTFTPNLATDLLMNSGDEIVVDIHDTSDGVSVRLDDRTTGERGSMTASRDNGFAQVIFDPLAKTCSSKPYAFHPMFASSNEHTFTSWTAHTFNVGFGDDIGHFTYCERSVPTPGGLPPFGTCNRGDEDDLFCFSPADSTLVAVDGCIATDRDTDSVPYQLTWPGTLPSAEIDRQTHPQPLRFASPTFQHGERFERVAFETNTASFESSCDPLSGSGCTVVPPGATFYPFFTTSGSNDDCLWQLGGNSIPGTTTHFGGSAKSEYGQLLQVNYPGKWFQPVSAFAVYRKILRHNRCEELRRNR